MKGNLILIRHGQSIWNRENRFTGWSDVDLLEQGIIEAHRAGKQLAAEGFIIDIAFTSVLKRAIRTLWIVLDEHLEVLFHHYLGDSGSAKTAIESVTPQAEEKKDQL